ncbi:MAG: hypothetical protein A2725_01985 [Candidatus Magasanikbacteria bacterium RIFCSPHIGHO2_01_FULL_33_34]|uniref:Uncharacterized protein n=1 Tax=Candidatus Magasanikbacteria bacterium RIFCSPHIGHO2_01_FULL_33_34 TaxID=1798671 RepID=A0A1F6LKB3_9BACT|nr:MAG: hypothetical protein A2725_01985 [Candidatus Magasanikbacteria bacterium RIFCSPHIGHO2_01_FULL_33_34]OGH65542.1 MAG: hypothetical protein A3B83_01560 [Candidatus Magasanikbacteria bacterium RIFCSPHIGHO2_02_FULL_33_17]OGH76252.1 MAG: hypothetical protein A3A89_02380 [Candidatus Magasanikbacteria bacterium RIFCSPLOWO2_01_FULL_33_34]OGH81102.1 MAG: hypothetical protein A3F93_00040 [Candidatus Magasanikbacteria bacterium RIFCSPLOWO2_12_FULL_34_7]
MKSQQKESKGKNMVDTEIFKLSIGCNETGDVRVYEAIILKDTGAQFGDIVGRIERMRANVGEDHLRHVTSYHQQVLSKFPDGVFLFTDCHLPGGGPATVACLTYHKEGGLEHFFRRMEDELLHDYAIALRPCKEE